ARGDVRDDLTGDRAHAVEGLARHRVDMGAVDEGLGADVEAGDGVGDAPRPFGDGGHRMPPSVRVGAPADAASITRIVRAPSPRRSRSNAASTPSSVSKWVTTPARSSSPETARSASPGSSAAGSPEP